MLHKVRHCNVCGSPVDYRKPEDDHQPRHVCRTCGHIQYFNPNVVVGCIPEWRDGRVLMCRRSTEPGLGLWTFPGGFMELGETGGQAAAREALEEAEADVEILDLMAVINAPHISQLYLIYRARMRGIHHGATAESSETCLMYEADIPWEQLAFPSVWHSLDLFFTDRAAGNRRFHTLDLTREASRRSVIRPERLPPVMTDTPGDCAEMF
ncbi:MAG: NUDIX hydrolase [Nevskia sp.]|nr:NUDIX hydrolase [Nevskia sp.]